MANSKNMNHDEFFDLLVEYVLDQQTEEVRLKIKAHLDSGCVACRTELQVLQETIHLLPLSLRQKEVSPSMKLRIDRVLDAESSNEQSRESGQHRVSHYRLLRRLGIGGMGEVYLAEDTKLGRSTALKIIRPEVAANVELKKRFLREARAAAVLSHPGIATIYEIGEEQGTDFIAMEYVEGRALSELLSAGPLGPDRVIRLGIQLADALSEAHQRGILHRDLKPENIQVRNDDHVKILDFGLAKFLESRLHDDYTTTSDRILGTIPYMSPEQIEGTGMDARSDVFSLGSILYQMASGKAPFTGENPGETLSNILKRKMRPLPELVPDFPPGLEIIINRCLQIDPQLRYSSAKELEADLIVIQKGRLMGREQPAPAPVSRISIAVLYFENLSREREDDYFRAGMTEDIIVELSKVKSWEIRPRTQVVRYKDQEIDLGEIGLQLNVTHILQGSIRKAGTRLRISAQLVDTDSATSVWAERYDRDLSDIFEIQSEIARKIATALKVHLTRSEKKEFQRRPTNNLEAYDSYLRGREMIFQLSKEGIEAAREYFHQAIQADEKYALAYAGLAQSLAIRLSFYGGPQSLADEAIENAQKALSFDQYLAQANAALGLAYFLKGMVSEAREACKNAIQLNPHDAFAAWICGRIAYRLNQYEESVHHLKKTVELLPDFYTAYSDLAQAYENLGMVELAMDAQRKTVAACRRYLETSPNEARAHIFLATSSARLGARTEALTEGQLAAKLSPDDPVMMYNLSCLYSLLDEKEAAVQWLAKSIQYGRRDFEWMKRDPALENIRNHPVYKTLLAGS